MPSKASFGTVRPVVRAEDSQAEDSCTVGQVEES